MNYSLGAPRSGPCFPPKHETWNIRVGWYFWKWAIGKLLCLETDAKKDFAQNLGNKQFQPIQLFIKMLAYLQENSSFLFIW